MASIKIKKIDVNAVIPKYQSDGASGFDLCSSVNTTIKAGKWSLVKTGLSFSFKKKYEIQIRPRSGLALKHGITVLNTPGTIDSDYRGEIQIIMMNLSDTDFEVKIGDRIAQAVLCKVERAKIKKVNILKNTKRGSGGFGSTGK